MLRDPDSFIQDADIEMADLQEAANREARLKRKGICTHGHLQGPPGKPKVTCLNCGKVFADFEEAYEARAEALI